MRKATKPGDYVAIAAWGRKLGSYPYYIENEQLRAFDANAPIDAVYKKYDTAEWQTVSAMMPEHEFRQQYAEALKARGLDELEAWRVKP